MALIDHGRLLAVETPGTLSRLIAKHERIAFRGGHEALLDSLRRLPGVTSVIDLVGDGCHRIELSEESATQHVLAHLVQAGVNSIQTSRPTLEEVYVHIIGDRGLKV